MSVDSIKEVFNKVTARVPAPEYSSRLISREAARNLYMPEMRTKASIPHKFNRDAAVQGLGVTDTKIVDFQHEVV